MDNGQRQVRPKGTRTVGGFLFVLTSSPDPSPPFGLVFYINILSFTQSDGFLAAAFQLTSIVSFGHVCSLAGLVDRNESKKGPMNYVVGSTVHRTKNY